LIVAIHQPDLLPYSGFWYKMAKADVFEVGIYYQFVSRGYQRRVKMRESWASVPIVGNPTRCAIKDVRIDPATAGSTLANAVAGRYAGSPHWKTRGPALIELIRDIHTDRLWQFNLELILGVRDLLGLRTPVSIGSPLEGTKSDALVSALRHHTADTYLAGSGARVYMGDCAEFIEAGIAVEWSRHEPVTGDSIVTVLMDYEDPMSVVLRESTP
jgi:hypothetical protein